MVYRYITYLFIISLITTIYIIVFYLFVILSCPFSMTMITIIVEVRENDDDWNFSEKTE